MRRVDGYKQRIAPPVVRVGELEIDEPRHGGVGLAQRCVVVKAHPSCSCRRCFKGKPAWSDPMGITSGIGSNVQEMDRQGEGC